MCHCIAITQGDMIGCNAEDGEDGAMNCYRAIVESAHHSQSACRCLDSANANVNNDAPSCNCEKVWYKYACMCTAVLAYMYDSVWGKSVPCGRLACVVRRLLEAIPTHYDAAEDREGCRRVLMHLLLFNTESESVTCCEHCRQIM
jgi:hypothetical protein